MPQETQPEVCSWFSGVMTQLETTPRKTRRRHGDGNEEYGQELAMDHLSYDRAQVREGKALAPHISTHFTMGISLRKKGRFVRVVKSVIPSTH